jgi:hypothetical protein
MHGPAHLSCDQVLIVATDALQCNTAAIHYVQKLSPARPANRPAAATPTQELAAAAPSSSAGALPAPATAMAVYIISTSRHLAVLAVKGGMRKILKANDTNMFVDDYLSREEQLERKRREPERAKLKADGLTVGWRGAQLWMVVKQDGERDVWRIVPAAPAAPQLPAPPVTAAAPEQPAGLLAATTP